MSRSNQILGFATIGLVVVATLRMRSWRLNPPADDAPPEPPNAPLHEDLESFQRPPDIAATDSSGSAHCQGHTADLAGPHAIVAPGKDAEGEEGIGSGADSKQVMTQEASIAMPVINKWKEVIWHHRVDRPRQEAFENEERERVISERFARRWLWRTLGRNVTEKKITKNLNTLKRNEEKCRNDLETSLEAIHEKLRDIINERKQEELGRLDRAPHYPQELPRQALSLKESMISCELLAKDSLLSLLNLKLNASLDPRSRNVSEALELCASNRYDFGFAYSLFRGAYVPATNSGAETLKELMSLEEAERRRRAQDLSKLEYDSDGYLTIPKAHKMKPRRIWDLYGNRVVPWEVVASSIENKELWAISHSWVEPSERHSIYTPANNFQWPVPLPKSVELEDIRNELLRHGAEYCWLDVVCLRQELPLETRDRETLEGLRTVEWEVDIPTIGNVYCGDVNILRYYNGLGLPYDPTAWDSEYHWANRVWTIQEAKCPKATGGLPFSETNGVSSLRISSGPYNGESLKQFESRTLLRGVSGHLGSRPSPHVRVEDSSHILGQKLSLFNLLDQIKHRYATREVDKIAAVGFFTAPLSVPVFSETLGVEESWRRLIRRMPIGMKEELLFRFPVPSKSPSAYNVSSSNLVDPGRLESKWYPTWEQIQSHRLDNSPEESFDISGRSIEERQPSLGYSYSVLGEFIQTGELSWERRDLSKDKGTQFGCLDIYPATGVSDARPTRFEIAAYHGCDIPGGRYSFVRKPETPNLVVCRHNSSSPQKQQVWLSKVSVITLSPDGSKQFDSSRDRLRISTKLCKFP